jgi:hypothetical protein
MAPRRFAASVALSAPDSTLNEGLEVSRSRFTVSEKLSPGLFATRRRSYAELFKETVRLTIGLHIYRDVSGD